MIVDDICELAISIMHQTGHQYIRTEHLFFALFKLPVKQQPLAIRQVSKMAIQREMNTLRRPTCAAEVSGTLSASAKRILAHVQQDVSGTEPTADDCLSALIRQSPTVQRIWAKIKAIEVTNTGSNTV